MGGSTEGPIYSTIDATSEDLHSFTYAQHTSTTPYASTSIMPFTSQTQAPAHSGEQQEDGHWITQPGPSGAQYAQPDRCNGENGARDLRTGPSLFSVDRSCCCDLRTEPAQHVFTSQHAEKK